MYLNHEKRIREKTEFSELPRKVAEEWLSLTLIIDSYQKSSSKNNQAPQVSQEVAEKLFDLFLLFRGELPRNRRGYFLKVIPSGLTTFGRLELLGNQKLISEHLRFHCENSPCSYLRYESGEFSPQINFDLIRTWINEKRIDDHLAREAQDFGWCLGALTPNQVIELATFPNNDVVFNAMKHVFEKVYKELISLLKNKERKHSSQNELDDQLISITGKFKDGLRIAEDYEVKIPPIEEILRERLRIAKEINVPQADSLENLLNIIGFVSNEDDYHHLKGNFRIYYPLCDYAYHVFSVSQGLNSNIDKCNSSDQCQASIRLREEISALSEDGIFDKPVEGIVNYISFFHDRWNHEVKGDRADLYDLFKDELLDYIWRFRNWLRTEKFEYSKSQYI